MPFDMAPWKYWDDPPRKRESGKYIIAICIASGCAMGLMLLNEVWKEHRLAPSRPAVSIGPTR